MIMETVGVLHTGGVKRETEIHNIEVKVTVSYLEAVKSMGLVK